MQGGQARSRLTQPHPIPSILSHPIPAFPRDPGPAPLTRCRVGVAISQATPPRLPGAATPAVATPPRFRPRPILTELSLMSRSRPLRLYATPYALPGPAAARLDHAPSAQATPPAPSSPPRGASRGAGTDVAASRRHLVLQGGSRPGRAGSERDPPSAARPTARASRRRRWVCRHLLLPSFRAFFLPSGLPRRAPARIPAALALRRGGR